MFSKVLIAERGDLASRIARTCQRLGITTVGIRSESDGDAPHDCDEAVVLPDGPLDIDALLEAAKTHEVQAVHPGAGLPNTAALAAQLAEAEITFVGPQTDVLAQLETTDALSSIATRSGIRPPPSEFPERARHLAATFVGDGAGEVLVIGDHETSLSDEHGPLLQEASAPGLTFLERGEYKREVLEDCAKRLGMETSLRGLASVSFTLDVSGGLHLRGLSPYIEPAHALLEIRSGLDFVELQLRLANGEPLPDELRSLRLTGHTAAAYVRSQASPNEIQVEALRFPPLPPGSLRVESSVTAPATLRGEPQLLAHVVTHAQTRHEALLCLDRVLAEATITPLKTNIPLLRAILANEAFRAGQYDSTFAATVVP
jgi:acetyl/propionyl-CoA carboxylase alpha subunit